jgi:hypothetical protein
MGTRWYGAPMSGRLPLLAVLVVAGCAELDDHRRFEPVVGTLQITETIPAEGAAEVDPLARIDVCLSAEVDPRALEAFDVTLHSGTLTYDGEVEVQLFSWLAPGSRTGLAVERWCPGSVISLTPGGGMQPGLGYRVRLRPALLGWAGESLDTEQGDWRPDSEGELRWFLEFRVAGSAADMAPTELPELETGPTLTELFAAGEVFDPERGACSCHQGGEDELASARLDLSDPQTAWTQLVLRTGLESTDFPMITARRPSESYLLHKLVRTSAGERLHAVSGEAMPPGDPLPHADLVRIAHWIEGGALQ